MFSGEMEWRPMTEGEIDALFAEARVGWPMRKQLLMENFSESDD